MTNTKLTYAEFTAAVIANLTTDGTRLGVETFRDNLIQAGARDIQQFITRYQRGNTKILYPADFTDNGLASQADLEPGAIVREMFYYRTDAGAVANPVVLPPSAGGDPETETDVVIYPVKFDFDWDRRLELVTAQVNLTDQNAVATISPELTEFIIYPQVKAGEDVADDGVLFDHHVKYVWDGVATEWESTDETPFDAAAALVCSWYVKGMMTMSRSEKEGSGYIRVWQRERLMLRLKAMPVSS